MNDITALMATMKAAAEKAIEANERLCVMPPDEIFDVSLAHSKQLDADITLLNAHYDESTPANVKALVEALEKAQNERDEFRNRLKLERAILEDADKRIAELESRTVTVKLPAAWWVKQGPQELLAYEKQMLLDALAGAGIQVIEGDA
ncbi:ead/Ea22-like family protein [Kluyvera sichuanensis]|uniref:ead/Ea22-like family protein n=1 Tax=Kluyvera sichuanensis TaxID=2725494 RepID=UPI0034A0E5B5